MLRPRPLVLLALAFALAGAPRGAAAREEAPPCQPAKAADLTMVAVFAAGDAVRGKDGGTIKLRVANRGGKVVCRLFGELTLEGKARPVTCHEPAVEAGGETDMLCTFVLLPGERKGGGLSIPSTRRPGTPAPKDHDQGKIRVKPSGMELADPRAFKEWLERRAAAARRAQAEAAAARAGFRHHVTMKRASNAKDATLHLDRAFARLKECFIGRAARNPKLHVELKLRVGVSRSRTSDGPPESLLAVKVLEQKGPRPEVRDCVGVLDLTTLPPGLDFEALADVTYVAAPPDKSATP